MADTRLFPEIPLPYDSHTPLCVYLTKLADLEVRSLEAELADGWKAVDEDLDHPKKFKCLPWQGGSPDPKPRPSADIPSSEKARGDEELGSLASLEQMYQMARHFEHLGPGACVMVDAVSGRDHTVILAGCVAGDDGRTNVKLGRIAARKAAGALLDLPKNTLEALVNEVPGSIIARDLDLPLVGQHQGHDTGAKLASPSTAFSAIIDLSATIDLSAMSDRAQSVPFIICTTHLSSEEEHRLKQKLSKGLPDSEEVTILRWKPTHEGTLGDMYKITAQGLTDTGSAPESDHGDKPVRRQLFFLDSKSKEDDTVIWAVFQMSVVFREAQKYESRPRGVDFARIRPNQLSQAWNETFKGQRAKSDVFEKYFEDPGSIVKILDPAQPIDRREPLYIPQGSYTAPPVFFLADLAVAEEQTIKKELETGAEESYGDPESPDQPRFSYAPWLHTKEGGLSAMLKIMSYTLVSQEVYEYIFVDARSALDQTVIVADRTDEVNSLLLEDEDEGREGFTQFSWVRVHAREAHSCWVNLDVANMGIEDFGEGDEEYQCVSKSEEEIRTLAKEASAEGLVEGTEWNRLMDEKGRSGHEEEHVRKKRKLV